MRLSSSAFGELGGLAQQIDVQSLGDSIDNSGLSGWDYGRAAIILVGSLVVSRVIKIVVRRVMSRSSTDPFVDDLIARLVGYLVVTIGLVYALDAIGVAIGPLLGALGIVGIALAFALQDILENFVAGIMLQARRPFSRGDQITIADHEGTVRLVDSRIVEIITPDGEIVRIPSAQVVKNPIINHTQNGSRRTTLVVGVAYGTHLREAQQLLLNRLAETHDVLASPEPEVWVTEFGESSINLAVRFWHKPRIADMWRAQSNVALTIDDTFRDAGIEIPFPQRVINLGDELADRVAAEE